DDFKQPEPRTTDRRSEHGRNEVSNKAREPDSSHLDSIIKATSLDSLQDAFKTAWGSTSSTEIRAAYKAAYDTTKAALGRPAVAPNFDGLDDTIPYGGDLPPETAEAVRNFRG